MKEFLRRLSTICLVLSAIFFGVVSPRCKRTENCFEDRPMRVVNARRAADDDEPSGDTKPLVKRKRCCPYDFDATKCRVLDNRVLCGYERNVGWPTPRNEYKELSLGCRLRGGRLECGYVDEPHPGIRRPPAWDRGQPEPSDDSNPEEPTKEEQPEGSREKLSDKLKVTAKAVPDCVEIDTRIVCKALPRQRSKLKKSKSKKKKPS